MEWLDWLGDKIHNRAVETILGAIVILAGGVIWFFNRRKSDGDKKYEPHNQQINASDSNSSPSVIGEGATINYNQSDPKIATEIARLNNKIDEFKGELKATTDPAKTDVLLKLIAESYEKQSNIEKELEKREKAFKEASEKLDFYKEEFGETLIVEAQKALNEGDTVKALSLFAKIEAESDKRSANAAHEQGQLLFADLDFFGAYEKFRKAAYLQPDSYEYQRMTGELATELADYKEAKKYFELAIGEAKKQLTYTDPALLECLDNLGQVLFLLNDLRGAKDIFKQVLDIAEKGQGQEALIAKEHNNIGMVLQAQDEPKLNEAGARFQKAIDIVTGDHSNNHKDVGTYYNNLGSVLQGDGDLDGAKEKYYKALEFDQKFYGKKHPKIAIRLNNIGGVLANKGELSGAKDKYTQAFKILKDSLGDDHPNTITTKKNLDLVVAKINKQKV